MICEKEQKIKQQPSSRASLQPVSYQKFPLISRIYYENPSYFFFVEKIKLIQCRIQKICFNLLRTQAFLKVVSTLNTYHFKIIKKLEMSDPGVNYWFFLHYKSYQIQIGCRNRLFSSPQCHGGEIYYCNLAKMANLAAQNQSGSLCSPP